ncbi:hypothetical protein [Chelativorans sp. Marseille-P2723]|uniref:hypothetical protein n=1 Tax=Chelativorans sp. Marseille-P2723 TaxID=2709133 RepID=UPI0015700B43|nr:hypothetical protein [Chelativorans sp. Marseille-P2723]
MTDTTPDYAGLNLRRKLSQYHGAAPKAIADGSRAQMIFFVEDAKHDIATLDAFIRTLLERNKELERERDDWKARVQRILDPAYLTEKLDEIGVGDLEARAEAAEAAEAKLAEAMKVIEPFAEVAEWDIGDGEDGDDIFWPMSNARYSVAGRLRVKHLRAARNFLKENGNGE